MIEAAPLVTNVEKNKRDRLRIAKVGYLGKLALELLRALLSVPGKDGKSQHLKVLESYDFKTDASLMSRFIRDLESASKQQLLLLKTTTINLH